MQPKELVHERKKSRVEPTSGNEIINKDYSDQPFYVGNNLPSTTRQALVDLLKKYKHVFISTPKNMVGSIGRS